MRVFVIAVSSVFCAVFLSTISEAVVVIAHQQITQECKK